MNMNLSLNTSILALKSVSFYYNVVVPMQLFLLFLVPVLADICILDLWGKSKIHWLQLLFKILGYLWKVFFSSLFSSLLSSPMSLLIILFLFKKSVFPLSSSLDNANGMEPKHQLFCGLCQEYRQAFPEQPLGNQTKGQIKLPNLHWPWKFWLVQESLSALTSDWNMLSVTTGWKVYIF